MALPGVTPLRWCSVGGANPLQAILWLRQRHSQESLLLSGNAQPHKDEATSVDLHIFVCVSYTYVV